MTTLAEGRSEDDLITPGQIFKALLTGRMPKMTDDEVAGHRAYLRTLYDSKEPGGGAAGVNAQIDMQEKAYAARKAAAGDNVQKSIAVLANIAVVAFTFSTIMESGKKWAVIFGAISVALMLLSTIVTLYMFMPKFKNWDNINKNENTKLRSLEALKAACESEFEGLLYRYMEQVYGEFHWNCLLVLERRMFGLACMFTITGVLFTAAAFVAYKS